MSWPRAFERERPRLPSPSDLHALATLAPLRFVRRVVEGGPPPLGPLRRIVEGGPPTSPTAEWHRRGRSPHLSDRRPVPLVR